MSQTTIRRRSRPNRITSKGQVTIPVEVRRAIGIQPGDAVDFVREGERFVLRRIANLEAEELARQMGYESATALAAALEEGAALNAERDLETAREWESLDAETLETWETLPKQ